MKDRHIVFDISDLPLTTPTEVNIARQRLESILAQTDEIQYAADQCNQWKEISDYMELLIKGGGKTVYDEDSAIEVPKDETPVYLEWTLWRAALAIDQMLHDFELELDGLNTSITQDQQELDRISSESVNAEKFIALVKRYTDFSELTPAMINEFIEKILVHQAEGKGASRTQEIEIFFNFVGKVEIPHEEVELTEEEIAAIAEQERRRAKKAEYNRRYMQKKRKQWKEQQEQAQEPQEPIELPLVQDEKGALSA